MAVKGTIGYYNRKSKLQITNLDKWTSGHGHFDQF